MANYRTSRVLPTVLTIIVIIIAIAGLVALGRLVFGGGGSNEILDTSRDTLLDTTEGSAVSMTVRGPIVADEDFRSYRILVSPTARQFQSYTGYLETIISSQSLNNNTSAYNEFVNALDKANLVAGDPFDEEGNDVAGICATGKVFEFRLIKNTETVEMLWTSTCSGSPGSLQASISQLSNLFLNQIPEDTDIADSLKL